MMTTDVQQPSSGGPWQPASWRGHDARHMPTYGEAAIEPVVARLGDLPGLVDHAEVSCLVGQLAEAAHDRAFVLRLGPAQESFDDANPRQLDEGLRLLDAVRKYLAFMQPLPVIAIGTLAGNYAHICQTPTEDVGDRTLTSYYGDMVNAMSPNPWGRKPDANRMLWAYEAAEWTLGRIRSNPLPVYTSHECANLHFEEALTRPVPDPRRFFASSAHLLTVDGACVFPGSAHVEYLKGIANPVAVRVMPQISPALLREVCRGLNPQAVPGKLLVITSLGEKVPALAEMLQALRDDGMPVVWMCDPLRANPAGAKAAKATLNMSAIADEVEATVALHAGLNSHLGGLHLTAVAGPAAHADRPAQFNFTQALQICSHFAHAHARSR